MTGPEEPLPVEAFPMFPLGMVLFPGALLPLQIFEPRYQQLLADCLNGAGEFGVVLIERGSEVGGGDVRTDIGTIAKIVAAQPMGGGRWQVMAVGTRRLVVDRWLTDDPYPRAQISDWGDEGNEAHATAQDYANLVTVARRAMALAAELGRPVGDATEKFTDDPSAGTFQVAALSPIGALDRQRVLATNSSAGRCRLLHDLLLDEVTMLAAQLSFDPEATEG